jgi:hypothetical protein
VSEITDTHNLFEEVPSLGIAVDMVMSSCQETSEQVPNLRVTMPAGARPPENLVRRFCPIGAVRPEIKQLLAGQGISASTFKEFERNTQFQFRYMKSLTSLKFSKLRMEDMFRALNYYKWRNENGPNKAYAR